MENDAMFAAEAEAEGRADSRLADSSRKRNGRLPRTISGSSQQYSKGETTPLLAERDNDSADGEGEGRPSESGLNSDETSDFNFQHLPWWKRPSIFWLLPQIGRASCRERVSR